MEKQNDPQYPEARGIQLMRQRDALLCCVAHADTPEVKLQAIDALEAWFKGRTDADWAALVTAEYGPGRAGRRALVAQAAECEPIGQRR